MKYVYMALLLMLAAANAKESDIYDNHGKYKGYVDDSGDI